MSRSPVYMKFKGRKFARAETLEAKSDGVILLVFPNGYQRTLYDHEIEVEPFYGDNRDPIGVKIKTKTADFYPDECKIP